MQQTQQNPDRELRMKEPYSQMLGVQLIWL
jgi:hypothetical protein